MSPPVGVYRNIPLKRRSCDEHLELVDGYDCIGKRNGTSRRAPAQSRELQEVPRNVGLICLDAQKRNVAIRVLIFISMERRSKCSQGEVERARFKIRFRETELACRVSARASVRPPFPNYLQTGRG